MRSYMMQTMGEEFGPFPLEFLREKLSNGLSPSTRVIVVEDGRQSLIPTSETSCRRRIIPPTR